MSARGAAAERVHGVRRCHVWRWGPSPATEWERRTLVVGGLSPFGLIAAGATAAVSAAGNRRRRDQALRNAAPQWRYVTSGTASVDGSRLTIREEIGAERLFGLVAAELVDSPAPGWIRVTCSGSTEPWAIQVI